MMTSTVACVSMWRHPLIRYSQNWRRHFLLLLQLGVEIHSVMQAYIETWATTRFYDTIRTGAISA